MASNTSLSDEYPSFPVTLDFAEQTTARWRQWMEDNHIPPDLQIKAFFIPIGDIQKLATTDNLIGVRAYLALTDETEGLSALKLLLTPVGPSPVPVTPDPGVDIIEPVTGTQCVTVYDFTSPCPNFCATEPSPLE